MIFPVTLPSVNGQPVNGQPVCLPSILLCIFFYPSHSNAALLIECLTLAHPCAHLPAGKFSERRQHDQVEGDDAADGLPSRPKTSTRRVLLVLLGASKVANVSGLPGFIFTCTVLHTQPVFVLLHALLESAGKLQESRELRTFPQYTEGLQGSYKEVVSCAHCQST